MDNKLELETQIEGTFLQRYLVELFRNSGYFAILNILLELLLEGVDDYLREPDFYALIFAALAQAYWLSRWTTHNTRYILLGNLIGPAIYTFFEIAIEGLVFFDAPHHIAYWVFSLSIGVIQWLRLNGTQGGPLRTILTVTENIIKSLTIFIMYMILEWHIKPGHIDWNEFIHDRAHVYLFITLLLIGAAIGIEDALKQKYNTLLKRISHELKSYSGWLFGKDLREQVFSDNDILKQRKTKRVVLFMDIRGFTNWSESHSSDRVAAMLNEYFSASEAVLHIHGVIKVKFTGDEVMAIFSQAMPAISAAIGMQKRNHELLTPLGMGAGIGIHEGSLMEGIMGAENIRNYDFIGDTVNTAKRIEGNAQRHEILVSETLFDATRDEGLHFGDRRKIAAKGKSAPLQVFPLRLETNDNSR
jgi:class 3 adenylate cyclase